MASDNEASCESDPNFAVICAFMEKFGTTCGLQTIDFLELQEMLENTQEVHHELIDLHIKLLRKSRKTVSNERWEKAVIKFCHTFCVQDAWEIERFGYKKARLSSKLRVLKELLEMQFDYNVRFKTEINKMSAEELRSQPIGRDKHGHAYWFQNDNNCQIRVYKDDQDEETWTLVAKDRDGLASLISELSDGDSKLSSESANNEDDSNSLAEKPIIDTGQVDSSSDSNKKLSGDSENSNESSMKKEEDSNISAPGEGDVPSDEEVDKEQENEQNVEQPLSAKRSREDDDDDREVKKMRTEDKVEVSEAIEEPLMLVKGAGNGEDNEGVNPIVGEEIEEDLMFVYGAGNGEDCQTGNEEKPSETKQSEKSSERDTSDGGLVSISSESKNCVKDEVPKPPAVVKSPYKLGTIIDTKTDNKFFSSSSSSTHKTPKKSRWDVEAIMAPPKETGRVKELVNKWEQQLEETKEETPKKSVFFFGPGCLQFKSPTVGFGQKVPPESNEPIEGQGDVGYRIEEDNKEETSDCVQSGPAGSVGSRNEHQTPIDKLETKVDEPIVEKIAEREERIPEVTAALIGYEDRTRRETKEVKQTQDYSVPVVEEICVKKHAYLLGTETGTEVVENHQEVKTEEEAAIGSEEATVEDAPDLKNEHVEVENVSKIDENENKQVIEQVPNERSLGESDKEMIKTDDKVEKECEGTEKSKDEEDLEVDDHLSRQDNDEVDDKISKSVDHRGEPSKSEENEVVESADLKRCKDDLSTNSPEVDITGSKVSKEGDPIELGEVSKAEEANLELSDKLEEPKADDATSRVVDVENEEKVSKCVDNEDLAVPSEPNEIGEPDLELPKSDDKDQSGSPVEVATSVEMVQNLNAEEKLTPDEEVGVKLSPTSADIAPKDDNVDATSKTDDKADASSIKSDIQNLELEDDKTRTLPESDNEEDVAMSTDSDNIPNSESKDHKTRTLSEPVGEVGVDLSTKSENVIQNLESKDDNEQIVSESDDQVGVELSATCDDIVENVKLDDKERTMTKSDDKVAVDLSAKSDVCQNLKVDKAHVSKLDVQVNAILSTECAASTSEQESNITLTEPDHKAETAVPMQQDVSKDKEMVKSNDKKAPDVEVVNCDAAQKSESIEVVKCKEAAKNVDVDTITSTEKVQPAENVVAKEKIRNFSQSDLTQEAKSFESVGLDLSKRDDKAEKSASKLDDDVKFVDKVEPEAVAMTTEKIDEVSICDKLPANTQKSKSENILTILDVRPKNVTAEKKIAREDKMKSTCPDLKGLKAETKLVQESSQQGAKDKNDIIVPAEEELVETPEMVKELQKVVKESQILGSKDFECLKEESSEAKLVQETTEEAAEDLSVSKAVQENSQENAKPAEKAIEEVVKSSETVTEPEKEEQKSSSKVTDDETVIKPVEKRAPKHPMREVRRQTRRAAQMAKDQTIEKEERSPETGSTPVEDPAKEGIRAEANKPDVVTKEAVVYLNTQDKVKVDEKTSPKEEPPKAPAKRGRKNNSSEQTPDDEKKPRVTRRTTRSSKNTETMEENVEEKPVEVPPTKSRRGRPRGGAKVPKEEASEEASKKMKLSTEEGPEGKRSLRSSQKVEEKEEQGVVAESKEIPEENVEIKDVGMVVKEDATKGVVVKEDDKNFEAEDDKTVIVKDDETVKIKEDAKTTKIKDVESTEVNEADTKVEVEEDVEEVPSPVSSTNDAEPPILESDISSDVAEVPVKDPLAIDEPEEPTKPANKPMSLSTFSLDFTESPNLSPAPAPPIARRGRRRKRGRESPAEDAEGTAIKRPKMKAKRSVDVKLRKSIEEQKQKELISSDDDAKEEETKTKHAQKKADDEEAPAASSEEKEAEPKKKKSRKSTSQRLLSNLGIDPEMAMGLELAETGVRQSRRIAQLKIREEAERRKMEDEMAQETHKKKKSKKSEDKDYKTEKKKPKNEVEEDEAAEEDSNDSKKKHKKKKKKHRKFDEYNPWRSSSDSSSSNEDDEIGDEEEEEDEDVLQYVSDHEFSPESDMEGDGEPQPLKRARTARKESDVEEEIDDCPCQKCGKSDHPEWILLCDSCDNGWHCSCLRPPLLVIPEGDWFCPPCQHASLLTKLQEKLKEYDKKLNKKEIEDRRKQRLAYVGISLNSVLPTKDTENIKKRRRSLKNDHDDDDGDASSEESDSESASGSETGSDSDEPIYQLRQRRQAHSYRFNDFDELINSAIQEEMDAVKGAGNQGRGKDIATIVNAEKEEERKKEAEKEAQNEEPPEYEEPLPPVVPPNDRDKEARPMFESEEPVQAKKKIVGRKKHRKLNALDISSADDDEDSDEDFKGTSSESDDEFDDDLGSDDSDLDGGRRRKGADPVRRSTRARTSRYDADFIDDGDSYSEDDAPRRKKKRSIWDESESEESDRSWGRRRRKPTNRSRRPAATTTKKKSKKKKKRQDSDEEVYRKKKPKIKFGLDDDDDGPVRRTRGKKINYVDALGSDSDEDRGKRPPPRIESDEEYVANEDEIAEDDKVSEDAESGEDNALPKPKIQIQSYTDARFTQVLPEPKNLEDLEGELNPIDQINRNVEMMDENEMEKMMEEEEYANKQLQMVAQQLEKEKRRKEREAKKLEQTPMAQLQQEQKKRARKEKDQFQFSGPIQEPLVGNVDNLLLNSENNDELSEPPGVSLPLFAELGGPGESLEDSTKKRRGKTKKSLEEAVANLGSGRQQEAVPPFMSMANKAHPTDLSMPQESNIEIATPPQPFAQSQPTPSVITRMLQSKPGQVGYPVGTIRPKQFATMPADDDHSMTTPAGTHPGPYSQGTAGMRPQLSSPYRQMASSINHFSRTAPPPQMRAPVPHMYHSHRPMDPSPSGGGAINMSEHSSPGRVVSPAASSPGSNKNETPPPPYSRPPPPPGGVPPTRFPMSSPGSRHIQQMVHLQPNRPSLSPYHPGMPPQYHYGQFGQEDALPPAMYQGSPYSEAAFEGQLNPSENSNSKGFEDESGGEFGGLVSYFSSQREDDLES